MGCTVGTDKIEDIFLDLSKITDIHLNPRAFANMCNLRLLRFYMPEYNCVPIMSSKVHLDQGLEYLPEELRYLHWHQYPLKTLPLDFEPENLIELNLPYSKVEQIWEGKKLFSISYKDAGPIKNPKSGENSSFELYKLGLGSLIDPKFQPSQYVITGNITNLHLRETAIEEVPSSIHCLTNLKELSLINCTRLKRVSTSICKLKSLLELYLRGCLTLESCPDILEKMEHLNHIAFERTEITEPPFSFENLEGLETLGFEGFSEQVVWEKYIDETRHDEQISDGRVPRTGVSCKSLVSGGAGAGISCSSTSTSSARPISCKKHKAIPAVFLLSVDLRRPGQRQLARHALQSENLGTKATQPPTTTEMENPLSRGGRITSANGGEARVQKWPIKR
ncbi:hypothetical protein CUMW_084720 [Citrus unshiu]|nr:hypothetical protein CUMW_084720 [Citrus unshiu]